MKYIFVILLTVLFFSSFGQSIELNANFSSSTMSEFKNNFGLGISYNQHLKSGNRIGFGINFSYNDKMYYDVYGDAASMELYVEHIKSENFQYGLKINYCFNLIDNTNSNLFIGPTIGLSYFKINEQISRYEYETIPAKEYEIHELLKNRINTGLIIEYEIKSIITKNLSTFMSIQPELYIYPYRQGWINFIIGMRYLVK